MPARDARPAPPPGRSAEYSGTVSAPSSARPTVVAAFTRPTGTWSAAVRASEPARVTGPHAVAAAFHPAATTGFWSSRRSRLTRSPVLMSTGQAVTHIPSTAQVCTPS